MEKGMRGRSLITTLVVATVGVVAMTALAAPASAQTTGCSSSALTVDPRVYPDAFVNEPYFGFVQASGGTYPYTFTLASGSPPPQLTMNSSGQVTGTPLIPGDYSFTVQVVDSGTPAQCQTQAVTVHIGTRADGTVNGLLQTVQSLPAYLQRVLQPGCITGTIGTLLGQGPTGSC